MMKKGRGRLALPLLALMAMGFWLWATPAEAITCDLTTVGSSCTINGALYEQMDQQPTGSDQIAFVRMATNQAVEQGYNTSFRPVQFNEITDLTHTHDLLVSDVPIVNIGGVDYLQFGLDINQTGSNSLLSLDMLQVFGSNTGMQTGYNSTLGTLGSTTKVYDMDGLLVDNWAKMDYRLNSGSGSGDIWFYLPESLISSYEYVYLYSKFGVNIGNNDGYEEWFVLQAQAPAPAPIPEPASLLLMGSGLAGLGLWRRKANQTA